MDERLRAAQREVRSDRLLSLRLKAGEVSEALVHLAAQCGDPLAASVLGPIESPVELAGPHHEQVDSLRAWARVTLAPQPAPVWGLALVGAALAHTLPPRSSMEFSTQTLELLRDWARCVIAQERTGVVKLAPRASEHAQLVIKREPSSALWASCDDQAHVRNHAGNVAVSIASGRSSAAEVSDAIAVQTHPIGGSSVERVHAAVLAALREVWEPALSAR